MDLPTHGTICGISGHTQRPQVAREFPTPFAETGFPDVHSDSLLADRLHNHVDVRMWLIRMQHHRIAMLESEFLPSKVLSGRQYFPWWRTRRHGKHKLVNQLRGPAPASVKIRPTSMLLEVEIPILEQFLRNSVSRKPLVVFGLKLNLSAIPET